MTDQFDLLDQESLVLVTERDLQAVIERHPNWMRQLMDSDDRTQIELPQTLYERLCLVVQKCGKAVQFDFCDTSYADRSLAVASTPAGELTLDFPVGMFALPEKENSPLAYFRWHSNLYNSDHTFSQWLIQNRPQLTKMVPAIYNTLIRTMVLGEDGATIRDTVNTILTRLRGYNGNCFGIHDGLFLTEADFV